MKRKARIFLCAAMLLSSALYAMDTPSADSAKDAALKANAEGMEFLKAGDCGKAEILFRKAVDADPLRMNYHNNLAVSFMRRKNYKEAFPCLQKAIAIDDRYAKALSNMAITCFYLGKYMDAYKYYLRAEDADKEYTTARFERNKALARIEQLSKENPDNSDYKQMLEYLKDSEKMPARPR